MGFQFPVLKFKVREENLPMKCCREQQKINTYGFGGTSFDEQSGKTVIDSNFFS